MSRQSAWQVAAKNYNRHAKNDNRIFVGQQLGSVFGFKMMAKLVFYRPMRPFEFF